MAGITYTLLVDNAPPDEAVLDAIQDVEVESHHRLAGIVRVNLAMAPRADGSGWDLADDEPFPRLANLKVLVTIGAGLPTTLIDAYVVEATAAFSEDPGTATYTVVGMDSTVLMNLEERVRAWGNMPDSAIALAIFAEHALVPIVDNTQPVRTELDTTVTQRDTDIRFLRHLAARNGFEVYVKPGPVPGVVEGHFHAPRVDDPPQGVLGIAMGDLTNVERLEARYEMLRPSGMSASGVDAATVRDQPVEVTATSLTELGDQAVLNGDRPRRTRLRVAGPSLTGELQTLAQAAADRSAWAVTATGEVDTAVYQDVLRAAAPVMVRGAGAEFSGTYYVERVLHRLTDDGYTQSFTLRRNALEVRATDLFLADGALPG